MKIFVTYSTPSYFKARNFAGKMAKLLGRFDKVVLYSPDDIDPEFARKNAKILSIKKGAGLWLWKPYIIYKALQEVANEGDYVFYCDAASFFVRKCDYIVDTMDDSDIWLSDSPYIEEQFTKEDIFQLLNCTEDEYRKSNQIQAQFFCARKSAKSIKFVKDWLDSASDFDLIGPENTKLKSNNCCFFEEHRYDQSLLSILSKRAKIKPHLSPLINGYPLRKSPYFYRNGIAIIEGEYPCCIILHHSPSINIKKVLVMLIKAWGSSFFGFIL